MISGEGDCAQTESAPESVSSAVSRTFVSNRICLLLLHSQGDGSGLCERAAGSSDRDGVGLRSRTKIASAASGERQDGKNGKQTQKDPSSVRSPELAEAAGKSQQRDTGKQGEQRQVALRMKLGIRHACEAGGRLDRQNTRSAGAPGCHRGWQERVLRPGGESGCGERDQIVETASQRRHHDRELGRAAGLDRGRWRCRVDDVRRRASRPGNYRRLRRAGRVVRHRDGSREACGRRWREADRDGAARARRQRCAAVVGLAEVARVGPVTAMLVMVRGALPGLESVIVSGVAGVLTVVLEKVSGFGLSTACGTSGTVPVPLTAADCGEPVALSATEIAALRPPAEAGVKLTVIVQLAPAASELPQLFDCPKLLAFAPVTEMLVIVSAAVPGFDSVIGKAVAAAPTNVLGNASGFGLSIACG